MNNQRGMLTSLITIGAAGAAIYGITRGVQNGTFKRLPQTVSNALNNPQVQQLTKSLQNMTGNQNNQQISTPLQAGTAPQNLQQQIGNNNQNNEI
ncbi:hypothetical protein SPD48_15500 [Pseudogracilibacillus sp. SE30717A]|uniref:hypothetical protein n=1 Tax=Pseudogracilibacillus sp. SE30717A TaxID=3098293 RepID=UPI00300E0F1B